MNEFMRMVFSELGSSLWKAGFLVLLAAGAIFWLYGRHRRKYGGETPFPWKRAILILLLVGYLAIVDHATQSRMSSWAGGANFRLFRAWREAWNNYSVKNWANVLLNVALFVPLGVLVPLVFPKCRKGLRMPLVAFGTSLTVEFLQWISGRGLFDVDDLFCNTLGALMGFCCLMMVLSLLGRKWAVSGAFGLLALIPVIAVGGIFAAYEAQPYGNLTRDYVYQIDTDEVTWTLKCDLPEVPDTAAVYRASPITMAECDDFGAQFARLTGASFDDVHYYDKETWFMDHGTNGWYHFLTVSYLDGSYEYNAGSQDYDNQTVRWADLDRAAVEEKLAEYGITVPAEADFTPGAAAPGNGQASTDGIWYCFSADRLVTAEGMVDGSLSCRFAADGSKVDIINRLVTYIYCGEENVISPAEAYQRMCGGWFFGEWFEYQDPETVSVLSCSFSYETDTKGFYQPVYLFEVMAPGWDGADTIMIPAIP